jgi:hypothetical protein
LNIIRTKGEQYGIQKIGESYRLTKTIRVYKDFESARNAMLDLTSRRKTEEEIKNRSN